MITVTLNSDRLTLLQFLLDHKRVLKAFKGVTINDGEIVWGKKGYNLVKKEATLFDVSYCLSRSSFLGKKDIAIKFSILPKNTVCNVSISVSPEKFEGLFDEKRFVEEFKIYQSEFLASIKPLLVLSAKRDEIPEIIETVMTRSVGQMFLLWFSSNSKYVRLKVKNGELVEKIGDFEDISGDIVDVIIKQLAMT